MSNQSEAHPEGKGYREVGRSQHEAMSKQWEEIGSLEGWTTKGLVMAVLTRGSRSSGRSIAHSGRSEVYEVGG